MDKKDELVYSTAIHAAIFQIALKKHHYKPYFQKKLEKNHKWFPVEGRWVGKKRIEIHNIYPCLRINLIFSDVFPHKTNVPGRKFEIVNVGTIFYFAEIESLFS